MSEFNREYLELLAEKYPDEAAACSEIINLRAILALPMGTEHFISDLHGEYGAVRHILNNCSGVILEKVRRLFEGEIGEEGCRSLCTLIYYPREKLCAMRESGELNEIVLKRTLKMLRTLAETLSSKYTRGYVRKQMPQKWSFVLDELLHMQRDEYSNQVRYHDSILESIISTGAADEVISALADIIKRLAVDRLHIVGDIFDRVNLGIQFLSRFLHLLVKHAVTIVWLKRNSDKKIYHLPTILLRSTQNVPNPSCRALFIKPLNFRKLSVSFHHDTISLYKKCPNPGQLEARNPTLGV